ncbi:MAG TPA: hypothetical protein PK454_01940, partial [Anaerolineaceae bacterium]|nr:hypothetical protein [Anaerolineaceae bacterium]
LDPILACVRGGARHSPSLTKLAKGQQIRQRTATPHSNMWMLESSSLLLILLAFLINRLSFDGD